MELLARLANYTVNLWRPGWAYPAERRVRGLFWSKQLCGRQLQIGRAVQFEGSDRIRLGTGARINDACQIVAGSYGFIKIGDNTHLARFTLIAGGGGVTVGARCMISSFVAIYSSQNDLSSDTPANAKATSKPVHLGDDVFVGVGAKIMPGITIGDRAVIAAGAVVLGDVAAGQTVAGVPARVLLPASQKVKPVKT